MRRTSHFALGAALALGCTFASSAFGAVAWTNPSGSAASFDWSGGQNSTNLFGSPTVVGDSFIFSPVDFSADSVNGVPDQARDTFSVVIDVRNDLDAITDVQVREFGDYSILGTGTIQVQGAMFATILDADDASLIGDTVSGQLVVTPGMPLSTTTAASGIWSGDLDISFALPAGVKTVQLVMNNNLQAVTSAGSTAFVQKKNSGVEIVVAVVPEPATLSLLSAGALLLVRRRRA